MKRELNRYPKLFTTTRTFRKQQLNLIVQNGDNQHQWPAARYAHEDNFFFFLDFPYLLGILDVPVHSEYHKSAFTLPNGLLSLEHFQSTILTTSLGCPVDNPFHSEKVQQKDGNTYKMSQLLQDTYNMDQLAHLSRERIPER